MMVLEPEGRRFRPSSVQEQIHVLVGANIYGKTLCFHTQKHSQFRTAFHQETHLDDGHIILDVGVRVTVYLR